MDRPQGDSTAVCRPPSALPGSISIPIPTGEELIRSAKEGDVAKCKLLLEAGAPINVEDNVNSEPPLQRCDDA